MQSHEDEYSRKSTTILCLPFTKSCSQFFLLDLLTLNMKRLLNIIKNLLQKTFDVSGPYVSINYTHFHRTVLKFIIRTTNPGMCGVIEWIIVDRQKHVVTVWVVRFLFLFLLSPGFWLFSQFTILEAWSYLLTFPFFPIYLLFYLFFLIFYPLIYQWNLLLTLMSPYTFIPF